MTKFKLILLKKQLLRIANYLEEHPEPTYKQVAFECRRIAKKALKKMEKENGKGK